VNLITSLQEKRIRVPETVRPQLHVVVLDSAEEELCLDLYITPWYTVVLGQYVFR
jgi:hypothetical protein